MLRRAIQDQRQQRSWINDDILRFFRTVFTQPKAGRTGTGAHGRRGARYVERETIQIILRLENLKLDRSTLDVT
jgi:hypothetical protein